MAEVEPLISLDGIAAAAHEPDAGVVDAGKLALAWFAEAVALGVEVHVGEAVSPDARVTAICAGGWSTEMAPEIPVILRRIEISVHGEAPVRATVSDAVTNVVTRPITSGGAWVVAYGGDVQYARRDDCDGLPDPAYEDAVRAALRQRYPSIAGAPRIGGWAGAYDTTPDWNPAIGFLDDERYVVMGMSGPRPQAGAGGRRVRCGADRGPRTADRHLAAAPTAVRGGRPAAPRLRTRRSRLTV